jgi:rubrerythrin
MTKKKFQCEDCGYYWEKNPAEKFPLTCPVCSGSRIHQSAKHKRFAKKSRVNVRRTYTTRTGTKT